MGVSGLIPFIRAKAPPQRTFSTVEEAAVAAVSKSPVSRDGIRRAVVAIDASSLWFPLLQRAGATQIRQLAETHGLVTDRIRQSALAALTGMVRSEVVKMWSSLHGSGVSVTIAIAVDGESRPSLKAATLARRRGANYILELARAFEVVREFNERRKAFKVRRAEYARAQQLGLNSGPRPRAPRLPTYYGQSSQAWRLLPPDLLAMAVTAVTRDFPDVVRLLSKHEGDAILFSLSRFIHDSSVVVPSPDWFTSEPRFQFASPPLFVGVSGDSDQLAAGDYPFFVHAGYSRTQGRRYTLYDRHQIAHHIPLLSCESLRVVAAIISGTDYDKGLPGWGLTLTATRLACFISNPLRQTESPTAVLLSLLEHLRTLQASTASPPAWLLGLPESLEGWIDKAVKISELWSHPERAATTDLPPFVSGPITTSETRVREPPRAHDNVETPWDLPAPRPEDERDAAFRARVSRDPAFRTTQFRRPDSHNTRFPSWTAASPSKGLAPDGSWGGAGEPFGASGKDSRAWAAQRTKIAVRQVRLGPKKLAESSKPPKSAVQRASTARQRRAAAASKVRESGPPAKPQLDEAFDQATRTFTVKAAFQDETWGHFFQLLVVQKRFELPTLHAFLETYVELAVSRYPYSPFILETLLEQPLQDVLLAGIACLQSSPASNVGLSFDVEPLDDGAREAIVVELGNSPRFRDSFGVSPDLRTSRFMSWSSEATDVELLLAKEVHARTSDKAGLSAAVLFAAAKTLAAGFPPLVQTSAQTVWRGVVTQMASSLATVLHGPMWRDTLTYVRACISRRVPGLETLVLTNTSKALASWLLLSPLPTLHHPDPMDATLELDISLAGCTSQDVRTIKRLAVELGRERDVLVLPSTSSEPPIGISGKSPSTQRWRVLRWWTRMRGRTVVPDSSLPNHVSFDGYAIRWYIANAKSHAEICVQWLGQWILYPLRTTGRDPASLPLARRHPSLSVFDELPVFHRPPVSYGLWVQSCGTPAEREVEPLRLSSTFLTAVDISVENLASAFGRTSLSVSDMEEQGLVLSSRLFDTTLFGAREVPNINFTMNLKEAHVRSYKIGTVRVAGGLGTILTQEQVTSYASKVPIDVFLEVALCTKSRLWTRYATRQAPYLDPTLPFRQYLLRMRRTHGGVEVIPCRRPLALRRPNTMPGLPTSLRRLGEGSTLPDLLRVIGVDPDGDGRLGAEEKQEFRRQALSGVSLFGIDLGLTFPMFITGVNFPTSARMDIDQLAYTNRARTAYQRAEAQKLQQRRDSFFGALAAFTIQTEAPTDSDAPLDAQQQRTLSILFELSSSRQRDIFNHHQHESRRRQQLSNDLVAEVLRLSKGQPVIVAIGGNAGSGVKYGVHGPNSAAPDTRAFVEALEAVPQLKGKLVLLLVDEWGSSKACPDLNCGVGDEDKLRARCSEMFFTDKSQGAWCHRVLQCPICRRVYNRDFVGSYNMAFITWHEIVYGFHPFLPQSVKDSLDKGIGDVDE